MARVLVRAIYERFPIGKAQPSLILLQGLDLWLLVDTQHDGVIGWRQIEFRQHPPFALLIIFRPSA